MAQNEKTSITVNESQKETVTDAQDYLENKIGVRPTQGEAVSIACEQLMEGEA